MQKIENLKKRLANNEIMIMDGGMGTEILHRGGSTTLPLWSAEALLYRPEIVQQIHEDYIRAGAEIIITDTFRTTRRAFAKKDIAEKAAEMTQLACDLAQKAIENARADHEVYIAGSIAPLEECYSPELTPPQKEVEVEHNELVANLQDGGVDFILFETMITLRETLSGVRAAERHAMPFAVSFCCNDKFELLSGEPLREVIPQIEPYKPLFIGINCVTVETANKLVKHLRSITDFPIGAYAQGEGSTDQDQGWQWRFDEEKNKEAYVQGAKQWAQDGAQVIGGCCGTTPSYIRQLAETLRM